MVMCGLVLCLLFQNCLWPRSQPNLFLMIATCNLMEITHSNFILCINPRLSYHSNPGNSLFYICKLYAKIIFFPLLILLSNNYGCIGGLCWRAEQYLVYFCLNCGPLRGLDRSQVCQKESKSIRIRLIAYHSTTISIQTQTSLILNLPEIIIVLFSL